MKQSSALERRTAEIIEFCRTPRSLKDMQEHFHTTYHTIWRAMRSSVEAGLLTEVPWREGREKQFVSEAPRQDNAIVIITPGGQMTLGQWAWAFEDLNDVKRIMNISGALAQLWRFRAFSESEKQKHLAGSTLPVECKTKLRDSLEFVKRLAIAIEQMLLAPVWDESTDIIEAFGEVDATRMVAVGEAFEKRIGKG